MKKFLIIGVLLLVGCAGKDGLDGADGSDGSNGADGRNGTAGLSGTNGTNGVNGTNGINGDDGVGFDEGMQYTLGLVVPKASISVLNIICTDGTYYWRGTGTKVRNNAILTARHVTEDSTSCFYYLGTTIVASGGTVTNSSLGRDLALIVDPTAYSLWSTVGHIVPSPVDLSTLYIGQMLLLVSYPAEIVGDLQYTFGFVTDNNVQNSLGDRRYSWEGAFTTDMAAAGGSSGGPVFDEEGQLIALHVGASSDDGLELNYTLPLKKADFVW
jgi:hypothetical protein